MTPRTKRTPTLVERAWGTARLAIATEQWHGEPAFRNLYAALGSDCTSVINAQTRP